MLKSRRTLRFLYAHSLTPRHPSRTLGIAVWPAVRILDRSLAKVGLLSPGSTSDLQVRITKIETIDGEYSFEHVSVKF